MLDNAATLQITRESKRVGQLRSYLFLKRYYLQLLLLNLSFVGLG